MKVGEESLALLTDFYQLSMGYAYFKSGQKDKIGVFNLFYRKNPFQGNYAIACGLKSAIELIKNFQFSPGDIEYLRGITGNDDKVIFDEDFLNYLSELKFEGDINAVEEGRVVFAHEPLMRIKAPVILGLLLETPLLNIINFQTLIATKAHRVCQSAAGDPVLEFGLRRAQGIDGSLSASYACAVGGVDSTSNVLAGKIHGIKVKGTHAHSWVMSFDSEIDAFKTYAKFLPNNCVFLVDTYDTVNGVKNAIKVAREIEEKGHKIVGIRLDSGDLVKLSQEARVLLDEAGLEHANIVASNDLDEYTIAKLKENGAKINVWGVGTKLVTAYDQPALGGVYKLSAIKNKNNWEYKIKKSEDLIKVSNPGILGLRRYFNEDEYAYDVLYNAEFDFENKVLSLEENKTICLDEKLKFEELLLPIFQAGKLVYESPSLSQTQKKRSIDFAKLSNSLKSNSKSSHSYQVCLEKNLFELKSSLLKSL